MSGKGGYYKYRCKYWLTFNCQYWVYVNNAACPDCLSKGRENEHIPTSTSTIPMSREVCVPRFEDGNFYYTVMEIIAVSDFDSGWMVKDLPKPGLQEFPTSTEPTSVSTTVAEGIGSRNHPVASVTQQQPGDSMLLVA